MVEHLRERLLASLATDDDRDALQVNAGIGFTWEHPSHVYLKRARARRSLLGSAEAQLDALADHVLAAH